MITNLGGGAAYTPVLGDRVRVVLEGEVTFLSSGNPGAFEMRSADSSLDRAWVTPNRGCASSVEKLAAPLPTTPGSVIREDTGRIFTRTDGMWRSLDTGNLLDPSRFTPVENYTVLYDAVTAEPCTGHIEVSWPDNSPA